MSRVLAVRLGDIKAFHIGGVAGDPLGEQLGVVVEIPIVERQAHLLVDSLQRRTAFLQQRHLESGLGLHTRLEGFQARRRGMIGG